MTLCFSHTTSDVTYSKQVTKPESHITSSKNKTKWPRQVRMLILDFDQWIQIICYNERRACMGKKEVKGGQWGRLGVLGDHGRQVGRRGRGEGRLGCVKVLWGAGATGGPMWSMETPMGSHEVKWDAMGFQGGMYWVPCGSRGASVGSHGVKGDVKGFPGGQVDVYSSRGSKCVKGDIRGSQAGQTNRRVHRRRR